MWPWKKHKTGNDMTSGLPEPKQTPPMPEVTFSTDVEERDTPNDFARFMTWLHRTRGPKHVQDSFFSVAHKEGSTSFRLSTIKGAAIRFYEEDKKC